MTSGRTRDSSSMSGMIKCKSAFNEMKSQTVEQLAETDEEKAEYERHWPFD